MSRFKTVSFITNTNTNTVEATMSRCNVDGCVHNKLNGKGSATDAVLELEAVSRKLRKACDARVRFLEKKIDGFKSFLGEQGSDADDVISNMIYNHFDRESDVSDIQVDGSTAGGINTTSVRLDLEEDAYNAYQAQLHGNAKRATSKYWSTEQRTARTLSYWRRQEEYCLSRINVCMNDLVLGDEIQDQIDQLSLLKKKPDGRYVYGDYRQITDTVHVVQQMFDGKEISWNTLVVFKNQLHTMLGWKLITEKHVSRNVVEVMCYWERGLTWAQAAIELANTEYVADLPLVEETDLDVLDNELIAHLHAQQG